MRHPPGESHPAQRQRVSLPDAAPNETVEGMIRTCPSQHHSSLDYQCIDTECLARSPDWQLLFPSCMFLKPNFWEALRTRSHAAQIMTSFQSFWAALL